jgi:hypothetical protein
MKTFKIVLWSLLALSLVMVLVSANAEANRKYAAAHAGHAQLHADLKQAIERAQAGDLIDCGKEIEIVRENLPRTNLAVQESPYTKVGRPAFAENFAARDCKVVAKGAEHYDELLRRWALVD